MLFGSLTTYKMKLLNVCRGKYLYFLYRASDAISQNQQVSGNQRCFFLIAKESPGGHKGFNKILKDGNKEPWYASVIKLNRLKHISDCNIPDNWKHKQLNLTLTIRTRLVSFCKASTGRVAIHQVWITGQLLFCKTGV